MFQILKGTFKTSTIDVSKTELFQSFKSLKVMLDLIVDTDYTDETTTIGGLCQR